MADAITTLWAMRGHSYEEFRQTFLNLYNDGAMQAARQPQVPEMPQDHENGWAHFNEDTGMEWSRNHPVESGECPDATEIEAMSLAEFRNKFPQVPAEDVERRQRLAKQMRAYGSKFPHRDIADDFNAAAEIIEASITALQVTEGDKLPDDECAICGKPRHQHTTNSGVGMCQIYPIFVSQRQMAERLRSQSNKVSKPL